MTATMTSRRVDLRGALLLSAWTFLVWTTRIRNIWTDEELTTGGQISRTVLALAFTAFAVAVVALWAQGRRRERDDPRLPRLVRIFAVWTTGVWIVRGIQIALADHDGAFIAVHTGLAVLSIVFAALADRGASTGKVEGDVDVR